MLTRRDLERQERQQLAPYAIRAEHSRGRAHREPEHPYRTAFQRDRDRIIHSTAFRRLEYKTQVFVIHEGDYYRTRLTHSLEVAQIARSLARALRLNEDLVEVIALAHDLGHGPFGHSGQEALQQLMQDHGGFDHNLQALRIIEQLEERYPGFRGLNLTWEVRQGLNKHLVPRPGAEPLPAQPTLEAQAVDLADEIAYDNHDLDDGLTSGFLKEEALQRTALWRTVRREVTKRHPGMRAEMRKYQIIRHLINREVTDALEESQRRLARHKIDSPAAAQECPEPIMAFSQEMRALRTPLKQILWDDLYHHYRVVRMADKAQRILTALFRAYIEKPEQLPNTSRARLKVEDPYRVVCDYIAGMTDRYATDEYRKLFFPDARL